MTAVSCKSCGGSISTKNRTGLCPSCNGRRIIGRARAARKRKCLNIEDVFEALRAGDWCEVQDLLDSFETGSPERLRAHVSRLRKLGYEIETRHGKNGQHGAYRLRVSP